MYTYQSIFENKKSILIVTAHPDDAIVFFGALIHRLVSEGKQVYVLLATNGARGSRENEVSEEVLAKQRFAEEAAALKVLGLPKENLFSLNYPDGEVESTLPLIGQISKYIRQFKVDLVATHEPMVSYFAAANHEGYYMQHRDHRKLGEAVLDAVYPFSRDRSFFTDHYASGIEPHTVFDVLLTFENQINFVFDYTDSVELKQKALAKHASQFNPDQAAQVLENFKFAGKYLERFNYIQLLR